MNRYFRMATLAIVAGGSALSLVAFRHAEPRQEAAAPTPEHALLARFSGTWDAVIRMHGAPGEPAAETKGTLVSRLACGGLWLVSDFEGEAMGAPFSGHEILGFDAAEQKFVLTWVDSMSTSLSTGAHAWDAATRSLSGTVNGRDPAGQPTSWRQAHELKGADARRYTMWVPDGAGGESVAIEISYTRRK
jgi:hypothetical protein